MNVSPRALREWKGLLQPLIALLLGLAGYAVNQLVLDLGWGMHFMFGNAVIFAFLRVLHPGTLIGAAALSSLHTIFLWHHPWTWIVWTLEAAFLVFLRRRSSPIRNDVGFWLAIGMPLMLVTHGVIMKMDSQSLWLVIAKQAANGVLNVTLAEIAYTLTLALSAARGRMQLPRVSRESLMLTVLLAIILIPATVYLAIDAPARTRNVKSAVAQTLDEGLDHAADNLAMWQSAHRQVLETYAQNSATIVGTTPGPLPAALRPDFDRVEAFDASGRRLWAAGTAPPIPALRPDALPAHPGAHLVDVGGSTERRLAFYVPLGGTGSVAYLLAGVQLSALQEAVRDQKNHELATLLLSSTAFQAAHTLATADDTPMKLPPVELGLAALQAPVLVGESRKGTALMNTMTDAMLLRAVPVPELPGWVLLGTASLRNEVLKARQGQLQQFAALSAFVLLVTLLGILLNKLAVQALRRLAQSAAELALSGTRPHTIGSLVVQELSDISKSITSAGSEFAREHAALIGHRRRLNSIAEHAPVLVYALEIHDGGKGPLLYVSDAITRLLGYSQAEVAEPGWWSHSIHPDDYDRCMAILSDLTPGKVVNLEYRLRHKLGHYAWVFDSLAVEIDPITGGTEAVGLLLDISDRKFATEQLVQADKMASLGRLVAGVTHELNQPLNFIKMATINLRERTRHGMIDAGRFTEKLDTILAHVNRASEIILHMRVFGRKPTERQHPVAISDVVHAVKTMVTPQLEAEGILLDTSDCASSVTVRALPSMLEQILLNLVLNAYDAIRHRKQEGDMRDGVIAIHVGRREWHACITVEDNGTGLPEEVIPLLFEPFFTTKPPREGTGLGLPICYGIVRDLGGIIWAENHDGGARFVIQLPRVDKADASAGAAGEQLPAATA